MTEKEEDIVELKRGQQMLRENIAESDRLIEETDHRLAESRLFTAKPAQQNSVR